MSKIDRGPPKRAPVERGSIAGPRAGDQDTTVGSHRDRLLDGLGGLRRADATDDHFGLLRRAECCRRLQRVLVVVVDLCRRLPDLELLGHGVEPDFRGVGYVLYAHEDAH